MGFLTTVKHGAQNLDVRHPAKVAGWGLLSHAVETVEYLGVSYAAARINTQFGDKAKFRGVEVTYAGGIVFKILAVLADIFGYGVGLAPHVNTISTALIATHLAAKGAQDGMAAKGMPLLPAKQTALGAIPPASGPNRFLDLSEVDRVSAMHG